MFTQDALLRLHFLASPFGVSATTYGITAWRIGRLPLIADFETLATYAGPGVIIYGMGAVVVDLGGQIMFYTIAAIIKFIEERKAERNASAASAVSKSEDLMAQAIRENPDFAARVIRENLPLAAQLVQEYQTQAERIIRENPALAAEIVERLERDRANPDNPKIP